MKKTITLLFGLLFSLNLFGQYVNYETDSRWFLNANVGGTWQTTDVANKTYAGWGLILGKSFNYNYGRFLRWDLRGRYLGGKWYGQDYDATDLPAEYDGVYNPYKDSLGYAVQNFESENHELGLELAVHLNKLRERTGVDLYAFGGANIVWNRTNGDLFDQDTLLGFDNIYNYDAIGLTESAIDNALDGIYETPLDGHSQKYRANFMPSLGFGIGYYFTPHFSVGLEHKTTYTLRDDWDGFASDEPQGKSQFLNDIYHYTSGYLRFHFRTGRTAPSNVNNSNNNNLVQGGCNDPVIAFMQPGEANSDVTVAETQFKVKVTNVVGRENITLRVNGNVTTNFLYNTQNGVLESYLVLAPGMNTVQVTAGNGCGSVSQNFTINYVNCVAPEVRFTAPSHNNFSASQTQFDIRAMVERASNVKFKVNGISSTSFYYNTSSGSFQSSVALQPGQNVFEIVATNECGTDTEVVTVNLADCNDPSVVFLNSSTNTLNTDVQEFTFKAQVLHVEGRANVGFRINGVNHQFTFDPNSKYVNAEYTLQEGTNTFQVTAANDCGTETETFTVVYTPCVEPFVQMIDPAGAAIQTTAENYTVKAKLFNISSLSEVQLTVNGAIVNGGSFNPTTKMFQKLINLQMGENTIKIAVTTDCGTDIEVSKVTRVKVQSTEKITICHRPPGNPGNAQTIEIPLSAWPAHQAHGDVIGPCPEAPQTNNEKITICHRPPGNPGNAQTLEIPLSAWPAHQAHGDVLGPCPVEEDHSNEKITICHRPPGNPGNAQTLEIPLSAWPAHQAHGDVLGACPEEPSNPGNGNQGNNGNQNNNEKITICHRPPGNPDNAQTLEIPLSAWPAHQAHGDVLGACPEEPSNPGNGNQGNNGNQNNNEKITICHRPPGNPDNAQTLEIPLSAWPAHQAHGDELGECPEEPSNNGNNGNGGNQGNSSNGNSGGNSSSTNNQGNAATVGTIGGSGGTSPGTVTGNGSGNNGQEPTQGSGSNANGGNQGNNSNGNSGGNTNTNTQGNTGSTGTNSGSGSNANGGNQGNNTNGNSGGNTNTNTQGNTGSTGTNSGSGSNANGGNQGNNSNGNNSSGNNGSGGGENNNGGGNKSKSGGNSGGGDNFNDKSSADIKAAEEAAKKKAAEEAAKKKAAEEAAKKKAAEEAAKNKAAEEAAKKKAAEEVAKKKAAEEAAKKKAAEEAAKKKAAEEAAKNKAAEEAAKKKAAEEAAKKKAAEEAAKKKAAEEAAKKKAAEEAAKKKAAEEAAKKKAAEDQKKGEEKPKRP